MFNQGAKTVSKLTNLPQPSPSPFSEAKGIDATLHRTPNPNFRPATDDLKMKLPAPAEHMPSQPTTSSKLTAGQKPPKTPIQSDRSQPQPLPKPERDIKQKAPLADNLNIPLPHPDERYGTKAPPTSLYEGSTAFSKPSRTKNRVLRTQETSPSSFNAAVASHRKNRNPLPHSLANNHKVPLPHPAAEGGNGASKTSIAEPKDSIFFRTPENLPVGSRATSPFLQKNAKPAQRTIPSGHPLPPVPPEATVMEHTRTPSQYDFPSSSLLKSFKPTEQRSHQEVHNGLTPSPLLASMGRKKGEIKKPVLSPTSMTIEELFSNTISKPKKPDPKKAVLKELYPPVLPPAKSTNFGSPKP
ncbi:hypothetical protein PTTG_01339 [Puccinia triticina 1-1 BBBD Race 1]|uniref:Uncharacterized protein n=1 Tax=Puccinia triticina (isolate 1-1 / race 1 (BBBD)) TaxID=630390 RepID=A0A0C4EKR2_PUCT1|nr:hypothetical protein PTTG_01339 [Puccinia triticina 1-1 BBBD Race 1]